MTVLFVMSEEQDIWTIYDITFIVLIGGVIWIFLWFLICLCLIKFGAKKYENQAAAILIDFERQVGTFPEG